MCQGDKEIRTLQGHKLPCSEVKYVKFLADGETKQIVGGLGTKWIMTVDELESRTWLMKGFTYQNQN